MHIYANMWRLKLKKLVMLMKNRSIKMGGGGEGVKSEFINQNYVYFV